MRDVKKGQPFYWLHIHGQISKFVDLIKNHSHFWYCREFGFHSISHICVTIYQHKVFFIRTDDDLRNKQMETLQNIETEARWESKQTNMTEKQ